MLYMYTSEYIELICVDVIHVYLECWEENWSYAVENKDFRNVRCSCFSCTSWIGYGKSAIDVCGIKIRCVAFLLWKTKEFKISSKL